MGKDYAIGGAIALGAWASPRATKDKAAGAEGDVDDWLLQSKAQGMAVMSWRGIRRSRSLQVPSVYQLAV